MIDILQEPDKAREIVKIEGHTSETVDMEEFEHNQPRYLRQMQAGIYDYKIKHFINSLEIKLQESLYYDKMITTQLAQRKRDKFDDILGAASLLGGTVQNHWIGFLGHLTSEGISKARDKIHEFSCNMTKEYTKLNIGRLSTVLAGKIAFRYQNQIRMLDNDQLDGVEGLVDYFHDKVIMKIHSIIDIDAFLIKIGFYKEISQAPEAKLFKKMVEPGGESMFLRLDVDMCEEFSGINQSSNSWNTEEMISKVTWYRDGKYYARAGESDSNSNGISKYGFCYIDDPKEIEDNMIKKGHMTRIQEISSQIGSGVKKLANSFLDQQQLNELDVSHVRRLENEGKFSQKSLEL